MRRILYVIFLTTLLMASGIATAQTGFQTRVQRGADLFVPDADINGIEIPFDFTGVDGNTFFVAVSFIGDGPCTPGNTSADNAIVHNFLSDLVVTLISPNGTEVVLFQDAANNEGGRNLCGAVFSSLGDMKLSEASRFDAPFSGFWESEEPLDVLSGQPVSGLWRLRVSDIRFQDAGVFNSAILYLETEEVVTGNVPPTVEFTTPLNTGEFLGPDVEFTGKAADFEGELASVNYVITNPADGSVIIPFSQANNDSGDWTQWSFTATLPAKTEVLINVRSEDADGNNSDFVFRRGVTRNVTTTPPSIAVLSPPSEITVIVSPATRMFTFEIMAQAFGGQLVQDIEFSTGDGFSSIMEEGNSVPEGEDIVNLSATLPFPPNVNSPGNFVTFEFRSIDTNGGQSASVSRNFIIGSVEQLPIIRVDSPSRNRFISIATEEFPFSGTAVDPDGSIELVEFRYFNETETVFNGETIPFSGFTEWVPADPDPDTGDFDNWSFTLDDLDLPENRVQIRATDNEMNLSEIIERVLTKDSTINAKPIVNITIPSNNPTVGGDVDSFSIEGVVDQNGVPLTRITATYTQDREVFQIEDITTNVNLTRFSFEVPLDFLGETTVNVGAVNEIGETDVESRVITRLTPPFLTPKARVQFPALAVQQVMNNVDQISVSGTTIRGTADIDTVLFSFGSDPMNLTDEMPVTSLAPGFAEWTVTIPLDLFSNQIIITPVDVDGERGDSVIRNVVRDPVFPSIQIISPLERSTFDIETERVLFTGISTDPDGAIDSIQYRISNEGGFNAAKDFDTTAFFVATDTSANQDWSTFEFNAPVGPGPNIIEIRAFNNEFNSILRIDSIATDQRTIILPLSDLFLIR